MGNNSTLRSGFILLAIGLIMVVFILFSKINAYFDKKSANSSSTNETTQTIQIEESSDFYRLVKDYMDGIVEKDPEKLISGLPDFTNFEISDMQTQIDELYTSAEGTYGANVVMSYEIENGTKVDDETRESYNEQVKELYESFDSEISEMYQINVILTATGDTNSGENEIAVYVGMIDGTWYIV